MFWASCFKAKNWKIIRKGVLLAIANLRVISYICKFSFAVLNVRFELRLQMILSIIILIRIMSEIKKDYEGITKQCRKNRGEKLHPDENIKQVISLNFHSVFDSLITHSLRTPCHNITKASMMKQLNPNSWVNLSHQTLLNPYLTHLKPSLKQSWTLQILPFILLWFIVLLHWTFVSSIYHIEKQL